MSHHAILHFDSVATWLQSNKGSRASAPAQVPLCRHQSGDSIGAVLPGCLSSESCRWQIALATLARGTKASLILLFSSNPTPPTQMFLLIFAVNRCFKKRHTGILNIAAEDLWHLMSVYDIAACQGQRVCEKHFSMKASPSCLLVSRNIFCSLPVKNVYFIWSSLC